MTRREFVSGVTGAIAAASVAPRRAEARPDRLRQGYGGPPASLRQGYGGPPELQRRREPRAKADSVIEGVIIGTQSYSFRDGPLAAAIDGMVAAGIGSCELWQGHVEPGGGQGPADEAARERLRQWRLTVSLDEFAKIRQQFDRAGVRLTAYNISFRDDFTDPEIERGFEMARALGVDVITASGTITVVKRVDPVARQFRIKVGMHNHSWDRPNEYNGPEDYAEALAGASEYMAINLDIGHFTAANHDPVSFLEQEHARIVSLHIKDRKRNDGPNVPFGEGDTPIVPVLRLLRDRGWKIPANIEYEYEGGDTVEEVRRSLAYCRDALVRREARRGEAGHR